MPQQPEHGSLQITGSNNKILAGTLALFSCDDNRIVDGPTTSKCLENGEWTFPPPKCLGKLLENNTICLKSLTFETLYS